MNPFSYMSTKTLMTASWKLPSSPSGAPGAPDMVKASRDQSQEAPRRLSCSRIVPPDCAFHAQTWDRNSSRLMSRRDLGFGQFALHDHLRGDARMVGARLPERVEAAHPVPADQHVLQRVVEGVAHMQDAVTLGGGIMIENASAPAWRSRPP
jgi:hypothetical protein